VFCVKNISISNNLYKELREIKNVQQLKSFDVVIGRLLWAYNNIEANNKEPEALKGDLDNVPFVEDEDIGGEK